MDGRYEDGRPWVRTGFIGFGIVVLLVAVAAVFGWFHTSHGLPLTLLAVAFIAFVLGYIPGVLYTKMRILTRDVEASHPLPRFNDGWTLLEASCQDAVDRFHVVAMSTGQPQVNGWLTEIGERLESELDQARKLAEFGRQMDPFVKADGPRDPQLRDTWNSVTEASERFADAASDADSIRAGLIADPDLAAVRRQLDDLVTRLPRLRRT